MVILVRPNSTVSLTGISRIMSISCRLPLPSWAPSAANTPSVEAFSLPPAACCSLKASAHKSSTFSDPLSDGLLVSLMGLFLIQGIQNWVNQMFNAKGVLIVEGAIFTGQYRDAVNVRNQAVRFLNRQNVTGLQLEDLRQTQRNIDKVCYQFQLGVLDLMDQIFAPLALFVTRVFDRWVGQQLAYRLNHAKRNADVEIAAQCANFHMERRRHHDVIRRRRNIGELHLQLGADVLHAEFIHGAPRIFVGVERQR